jgi:hypothetical protein
MFSNYFKVFAQLKDKKSMPNRIRFMITDVCDLRAVSTIHVFLLVTVFQSGVFETLFQCNHYSFTVVSPGCQSQQLLHLPKQHG